MKMRAVAGYTGAIATLLLAALTPFWFTGFISRGVAALPLHIDEVISGGPTVRSVPAGPYSIAIHRPVYPHLLQPAHPFVQLDWKPVSALPARVSDLVDIDGDGQPDVRVTFDVPTDPKAPLHVTADPLNPNYGALKHIGKPAFSTLIVRVDDAVLVRIPVLKPSPAN